jgi:hypothetical protein
LDVDIMREKDDARTLREHMGKVSKVHAGKKPGLVWNKRDDDRTGNKTGEEGNSESHCPATISKPLKPNQAHFHEVLIIISSIN